MFLRTNLKSWNHTTPGRPLRSMATALFAVSLAGAFLSLASQLHGQTATSPGGVLRMDKADQATAINQPPDANAQMEERDRQSKQPQSFAAANAERKKQIAEESARLLKLASELKTEVDKTTKDTLSLIVIRKADEIERLAHSVKEKMKLTAGTN